MGTEEAMPPAGGRVQRSHKGGSGAITRDFQSQKGAEQGPWVCRWRAPLAWGAFLPAVLGDARGGGKVLRVWP